MEYINLQVKVSKEGYEVGVAFLTLVKSIKKHSSDGWDTFTDAPAIVMENFGSLKKAIEGSDKLDDEAKEDIEAFINGIMLSMTAVIKEVAKK